MDIVNLLISLASGAAGGNIAGAVSKENSLGTLGNTLAGLFGGGIGGYILQAIELANKTGLTSQLSNAAPAATGLDLGSILANIGTSGVSGAVLMIIVGLIKNALSKS